MNCNHQPLKEAAQNHQADRAPAVDIYETEAELVLLANLPGVAESGLKLEIDNGILTLEGNVDENGEKHLHRYYRQFRLTEKIDGNSSNATLKNGVLTLRLPKTEAAKPKKIAVRTLH